MQSHKAIKLKYSESDHLEMMKHPERWPSMVLPLKHRSRREATCSMGLLGFMLEDQNKRQAAPKVYVGSIFFHYEGKRFEDLPTEEYASLDAVVAAGWEVN
jgi:hypothetical protein